MINLKKLREEKKISQAKIASDLNFNKMTYCNWENEKRQPTIQNLCQLADYYNVSLDYLVGRNFNNEFGYLTNNEKELIAMFRQMNNDNQLMFYAEAKGILLAQ